MATVPEFNVPSVGRDAGSVGIYQAPNVENYAPKQQTDLGKALMLAGAEARKIADDIDDTRKKELFGMFAEKADEIETQYSSLSGKGAFDAAPKVKQDLMKALKDVEQMADNDMQRALFRQAAAVRLRTANSAVGKHAAQQFKVYQVGEAEANIKTLAKTATNNWASWNQADGDFVMYRDAAIKAAKDSATNILGLPESSEKYKEIVSNVSSSIVDSTVRLMVSRGQSSMAKEYLDDAVKKGDVNPDRQDDLLKLVQAGNIKDGSLRLSMEVPTDPNAAKKQLDQMFLGGKIDADMRDATLQRVQHNWSAAKAMQAENNKAAMGSAQEWILKNPGKPVLDMPANLYNWAKGEGHLAQLDSFANRNGGAADRITELTVRGQMINLAMNDPETFIKEFKESGFTTRMDLGANGIREMQNMATDMLANNGKFRAVFDPKRLQDAIPQTLLSSSNKDKRDAFMAIMSEKQAEWVKANPGKQPTPDVYISIAKAANEEWISIGSFFNSSKKAYQVRAGDDVKAVPRTFYDSMKKLGASDDEILKAWNIRNQK